MSWRRVPPVYSPVDPGTIGRAALAAAGLASTSRAATHHAVTQRFQGAHAILTDSGTSALVLALRSAVREGGLVAMPGYGCLDLIAAAIRARVRVVLYDLEPTTLSPRLESVRAALDRGAGALVVTPLYGYPPDMPALAGAAAERGATLIEDAAQGAGGTLNGVPLGAFGDMSVLSFGRGKGTTSGHGGALLLRGGPAAASAISRTLASPRRGFAEVAVLAAQWLLARPALYALPASIPALELGEMVYREAGEPRAMSAAAAAALVRSFASDAAELRTRRLHAAGLSKAVSRGRFEIVRPLRGAEPGYLRFALLAAAPPDATPRPRLGAVRPYRIALHEHPETLRVLGPNGGDLSGVHGVRDRLLALPTHSRLSASDVQRLMTVFGAAARTELPLGQPA